MSPEERAACLRLLAALHEKRAAEFRLAAAAVGCGAAMKSLGAAWQAGVDAELAGMPDAQEWAAQMRGFYTLS